MVQARGPQGQTVDGVIVDRQPDHTARLQVLDSYWAAVASLPSNSASIPDRLRKLTLYKYRLATNSRKNYGYWWEVMPNSRDEVAKRQACTANVAPAAD